MADEDAVLVLQRHHVGDQAQGRQHHAVQQEVPVARRDPVAAAGQLAQRPGHLEGHPRAGQAAEGIGGAGQARMHPRRRLGQLLLHLVMIGDDQLQAEPARFLGLGQAGDAAIDRNHQRGARLGDLPQGLGVEAVTFLQAIGHVEIDTRPQQAQRLPEDGRARDAIGVVVAVDADAAAGAGGGVQALGGLGGAGQQLRRVQARQRRLKEAAGDVRLVEAAVEQQLGHDRRQAQRGGQPLDGWGVVRQQLPGLGDGPQGWVPFAAEVGSRDRRIIPQPRRPRERKPAAHSLPSPLLPSWRVDAGSRAAMPGGARRAREDQWPGTPVSNEQAWVFLEEWICRTQNRIE